MPNRINSTRTIMNVAIVIFSYDGILFLINGVLTEIIILRLNRVFILLYVNGLYAA